MVACGRMTAKRLSLPLFGAILCTAFSLWVSLGSLTDANSRSASRLGILPSPWCLVGAFLVAGLVGLAAGNRRGSLLWLSAITLLPWIPIPIPAAMLIWTGPLRWWVWGAIAVALAAPTWRLTTLAPVFHDSRRAPIAAAVLAACTYLLVASRIFPQLPAGDEPHYLVITQSLLTDGDLQIENNHRRGDYEAYYPASLKPDYLTRGRNGQIYSVHAPGLPAMIAPAFKVFGYPGVLAFLALVGGFGTGLAWRAAWLVTEDAAASWFGWAAVALSVPFLFQSFIAYPDGIGATLVMVGVLAALRGERTSVGGLVGAGLALAALPWLHSRFAVTAGALGAVVIARQLATADRTRRIAAFAVGPIAGALAWFSFFYVVYGTPNPTAPYGGYTQSSLANMPRGLTGLLFDQQFGLLPHAPVYLCAFAGFVPLVRRQPRVSAELALVVVPYVLTASLYQMWWGGFASPARFLASILLPLAIPAGVWFTASGAAARVLGLGALLLSGLISLAVATVDRGALLYSVHDGVSKLLRWASPVVDLTTAMPSLFQTSAAGALGRAAVWLLAIGATASVAMWIDRRRAAPEFAALTLGFSAAFTGMAAIAIVWTMNGARPVEAARGASRLLLSVDGDPRQFAIRYSPFRRIRAAELVTLLPPLSETVTARRATDPLAIVTDAAAATYTVDATIGSDAGVLTAGLDRVPAPLWTWDLRDVHGPWHQTVTVVNDARALRFDGDERTRRALSDIVVRAERRLPPRDRVSDQIASRAARYGPATVFLLGGQAYLEPGGSWIAGGAEAEFAIGRERGQPVQLFVRNFAVPNTVVLETDGWRQDVALKPREERLFDVPIDPARAGVVLRVRSATGVRPSDIEPGNLDKRVLGCWIETR
jgi:hypothetical protein